MLERREAEVIVVRRLDRLARTAPVFQKIFDRVYSAGGMIAVVDGGKLYNNQSELERVTLPQQLLAEYELRLTAKRTSDGKLSALKRGSLLNKAHYGYVLEREWRNGVRVNVPISDPVQAETVKLIVRDYLSGLGSSHIARKLNEGGVRSPAASKLGWNAGQVHRVLSWSRYYAGEPWHQHYKIGPRDLHFQVEYPALISQTDADSVARRLAERRLGKRRTANPLKGLIYCSAYREYVYRSSGIAVNFRSCRHSLSRQHVMRRIRDFLTRELTANRDKEIVKTLEASETSDSVQLHDQLNRLAVAIQADFDEPVHSIRKNSLTISMGKELS